MEMRASQKWVSYEMNNWKWVRVTREYNEELEKRNNAQGIITIKKNPKAIADKLGGVEEEIMNRIQTNNFACKPFLSVFTSCLIPWMSSQRRSLDQPNSGQSIATPWTLVPQLLRKPRL